MRWIGAGIAGRAGEPPGPAGGSSGRLTERCTAEVVGVGVGIGETGVELVDSSTTIGRSPSRSTEVGVGVAGSAGTSGDSAARCTATAGTAARRPRAAGGREPVVASRPGARPGRPTPSGSRPRWRRRACGPRRGGCSPRRRRRLERARPPRTAPRGRGREVGATVGSTADASGDSSGGASGVAASGVRSPPEQGASAIASCAAGVGGSAQEQEAGQGGERTTGAALHDRAALHGRSGGRHGCWRVPPAAAARTRWTQASWAGRGPRPRPAGAVGSTKCPRGSRKRGS